MFLTTDKPVTAFDYVKSVGISSLKESIESELRYLPDFEQNSVAVEMIGSTVFLHGGCQSEGDCQRALKVAQAVAGFNNVISQLNIYRPAPRQA